MALITCPECGKEISDRAPACINCGYPIGNESSGDTQPEATDLNTDTPKNVVIENYDEAFKIYIAKIIQKNTKLELWEAKSLLNNTPCTLQESITYGQALALIKKFSGVPVVLHITELDGRIAETIAPDEKLPEKPKVDAGQVKCPSCGSLEFSAGNRGYSLITGFIGSGKTVITCLKCGHRWRPGH